MPHPSQSVARRAGRVLRTSCSRRSPARSSSESLVGKLWPDVATAVQPLGDGFVRLIKAIIAPLVFCVVVAGIAKAGDLKAFGRIGLKALIWFEVATTRRADHRSARRQCRRRPAPGCTSTRPPWTARRWTPRPGGGQLPSASQFVLDALPDSAVGAFAENSLLQVLVLACLVGAALLHLGKTKVPQILPAIEQAQEVVFADRRLPHEARPARGLRRHGPSWSGSTDWARCRRTAS